MGCPLCNKGVDTYDETTISNGCFHVVFFFDKETTMKQPYETTICIGVNIFTYSDWNIVHLLTNTVHTILNPDTNKLKTQ